VDVPGKLVIPIGIVFAFLLAIVSGMLSWLRGSKHTNMLAIAEERQKLCHTCLTTLAIESTKQTTLLEQIANSLQRR